MRILSLSFFYTIHHVHASLSLNFRIINEWCPLSMDHGTSAALTFSLGHLPTPPPLPYVNE
jgi:hypothetical protein